MNSRGDITNAAAAYAEAFKNAIEHGSAAIEALQMADIMTSQSARDLFKKQSDRALIAYDNWQKAAQLALEIISEIETATPRPRV